MSKIPDHIKHIRDVHNSKHSYCGKRLVFEWAFTDVLHALSSRRGKSCLLSCPECVKKINEILSNTD